MSEFIVFFVAGLPAPGGSKRFVGFGKKTGRAILIDAAGKKNKNWRESVVAFAYAHRPKEMLRGALEVQFSFQMPRPKSHFRTGKHAGELRADAPYWHTKKPDALKLARSTEDALTNVIWADDAQTAILHSRKHYDDHPGCIITISSLEEPPNP